MIRATRARSEIGSSTSFTERDGADIEVAREDAALGALVHPLVRAELAELLRLMNSYYSNRIEGQGTRPRDIERAMGGSLSPEPTRRALQLLARAHVEVQRRTDARLVQEPDLPICTAAFICDVHRAIYAELPDDMRRIEDAPGGPALMPPGELRTWEVTVGGHLAPASGALDAFLARFAQVYEPHRLDPVQRLVAATASHHRLAWIHPFADGNGRVARLFTQAYFTKLGLGAVGLWAISRGFARKRERYYAALAEADAPRGGDLDGRGNLSERGLAELCMSFLRTALDQIRFMRSLLALDGLKDRIVGWAELRVARRELRPQAAHVLTDLVAHGQLERGAIARVSGMPERTARLLIGQLLDDGVVKSSSPKGPLRIAFPVKVVGAWLPGLFPDGADTDEDDAPAPMRETRRR